MSKNWRIVKCGLFSKGLRRGDFAALWLRRGLVKGMESIYVFQAEKDLIQGIELQLLKGLEEQIQIRDCRRPWLSALASVLLCPSMAHRVTIGWLGPMLLSLRVILCSGTQPESMAVTTQSQRQMDSARKSLNLESSWAKGAWGMHIPGLKPWWSGESLEKDRDGDPLIDV